MSLQKRANFGWPKIKTMNQKQWAGSGASILPAWPPIDSYHPLMCFHVLNGVIQKKRELSHTIWWWRFGRIRIGYSVWQDGGALHGWPGFFLPICDPGANRSLGSVIWKFFVVCLCSKRGWDVIVWYIHISMGLNFFRPLWLGLVAGPVLILTLRACNRRGAGLDGLSDSATESINYKWRTPHQISISSKC